MSTLTGCPTVAASADPAAAWCSPGRAASRSPASWSGARSPYLAGSTPYSAIQRCTSPEASDTSAEEARNSRTIFREVFTRSESVCTFIPGSALREHDGTRVREPSTSTTHTRQTFTGVRFSR